MAGSRYIATNLLDGATVTATGTASGSAVANLYNYRPSKTWISSIISANQRINIDLGSAKTTNFAALLNHNFPSGASVIIQGHSVAPPASGAWSGATNLGTFTIRTRDMWAAITATSFRYRSFYLENDGGGDWTTGGAPIVGEAVIGTSVQLTRQFIVGGAFSLNHANIEHTTPGGIAWMAHISSARAWNISYSDVTEANRLEVETMHTATAGAAKPVTWIPDPDSGTASVAAQVYYVRVGDVLGWTDDINISGLSLDLVELPTGISLT